MSTNIEHGWLKKKPIVNRSRLSLRRSTQPYYGHSPDSDLSMMAGTKSRQDLLPARTMRQSSIPTNSRYKTNNHTFKVPPVNQLPSKKSSGLSSLFYENIRASEHQSIRRTHFGRMNHLSRPKLVPVNASEGLSNPRKATQFLVPSLSGNVRPRTNIVQRMINLAEYSMQTDTSRKEKVNATLQLNPTPVRTHLTPKQTPLSRSLMKLTQARQLQASKCEDQPATKPLPNMMINPKRVVSFADEAHKLDFDESLEKTSSQPIAEAHAESNIEEIASSDSNNEALTSHSNHVSFASRRDEITPTTKESQCSDCFAESGLEVEPLLTTDGASGVTKEILDHCRSYSAKMNEIYDNMKSLDESFQSVLVSNLDDRILKIFSQYKSKKDDLLKEIDQLEENLENDVNAKLDIEAKFSAYLKRKDFIMEERMNLHKKFEEAVNRLFRVQGHSIIESYKSIQGLKRSYLIKEPSLVTKLSESWRFTEPSPLSEPTKTIFSEFSEFTNSHLSVDISASAENVENAGPVSSNETDEPAKKKPQKSISPKVASVRKSERKVKTPKKFMFDEEPPELGRLRSSCIKSKSKTVRRTPSRKMRSSAKKKAKSSIYKDLQMSFNLCSPDELENTPAKVSTNSSAKRREFSKKIKRQMDNIFDSS